MKRSLIALAAIALIAVTGCGGANPAVGTSGSTDGKAQSQPAKQPEAGKTIAVKISQPSESLSQLEVYVARGKGFFKDVGLEVEQVSTGGGGPDVAALLSGDVQFNVGPDSVHINLLQQGKKTLNVYNTQSKSIITMAINKQTAAKLGITETTPLDEKLKKLKGLNIGVTKPGALTDSIARYYAKRAGLDPEKDLTLVAVGSNASANAALEQGKIDILVVSVPQPEASVHKGAAIRFLRVGEDPQFSSLLMNSVHVTPEYAKQNPEAIRRFVKAMTMADEWIKSASPEEVAKVIKPLLLGFDDALLTDGIKEVKNAVNPGGKVTREATRMTLEVMGITDLTEDQVFGRYAPEFAN